MYELDPAYLTALAEQFGFLGAFLGGVSATFMVTLLTLAAPGRAARIAIALSAVAAVSFIVTAALSMPVIARGHPAAPDFVAAVSSDFERTVVSLSFAIGILSLLAAIGAGGWMRSRFLGVVTSVLAIAAAVPIIISSS